MHLNVPFSTDIRGTSRFNAFSFQPEAISECRAPQRGHENPTVTSWICRRRSGESATYLSAAPTSKKVEPRRPRLRTRLSCGGTQSSKDGWAEARVPNQG